MNPFARIKIQSKSLPALFIAIFLTVGAYAQTRPDNNFNFGVPGVGGPVTAGVKMISSVESGLPFTFSYVSPTGTTGPVMYVGQPPSGGLFRPANSAFFFNYTYSSGNVIPGAAGGTSGTGEYRLHFTQPNPSDTGINKLGNFGMGSMYMAIGAGNTADVIIQGFRAGRLVAQWTIAGLSTNNGGLNSNSTTGLFYAASDQYSGLTISFGSNWQFLDGITFLVNSSSIPLQLDNINFNDPVSFSPGSQASAVNFSNTTGITSTINWTKGTGDGHAVFMKAANSGATDIVPGDTYTANTSFGSGTTTTGGWTCVYNALDDRLPGTTNSVDVTNLTPGTTYRVMVLSYNGSGSYVDYNTNENPGGLINTSNFTTIAIPTTQASNITVTPNYTDFRRASINWTRGNGAKSAVFVRNNTQTVSSTVAPPHNDNNATQHTYSPFTDSLNVTSNGRVGSTEWYCVYNNAGSGSGLPAAVTMTRITVEPNQTLRVMVVEYNGGAGAETYNISSVSNNVIDYAVPKRPLPVTTAATGITTSTATMNGTITPLNGNITSGTFTYSNDISLTPVLGTIAITPTATTILGSALTTTVSGVLTALTPSTTYYYRLAAISNANTLGAATDKGSITASTLSFTTAPVISSVSASTANGSYKAGDVIVITVAFSSAVTVTGNPAIALNSGGTANYISGSSTSTLIFNYTVSGGETSADLDYAATGSLTLNGGTVKDEFLNDASLVLPTVGGVNSIGGQKNIVIDTQSPTLTAVVIASDHSNTALAKVGNVITLSFTSSEKINTPVVTLAGSGVAATNTGGDNWTATYTMASGNTDGTIAFNISFSDIANNPGTAVTATTNSSSVMFDKTLPTLSTVTILSNNTNTALAKTGDVVTLNFTSSETILSVAVTLAGNAATLTNTGGNNWSATYTMTAADASGTIPFNITFSDVTGNAGVPVTTSTNSSSVLFDKTIPTLSTVTISSNNSNTARAKAGDLVTINFVSSETIATPVVTIAGNTASVTNTSANNWTATYTVTGATADGTITFNISFSDVTGNAGVPVTTSTNSSSVLFDKTLPTLSTVTISSNNANTARAKSGDLVTINFVSSETIVTPVVTIAGNTASVTNTSANNWTATYTVTGATADGTITFNISFSDVTGNAGVAVITTTNSSSVLFDKTVPTLSTVTISSNNANTVRAKVGDLVTINFVSSEMIALPVVTIAGNAASVTNTSADNWTATYTVTAATGDGAILFNIAFSDVTGNAGVPVTTTTNISSVTFDKTLPTLSTVTILSNNTNTALAKAGNVATLDFTSSEAIASVAVTIAGNAAMTTNTGGNNWRATYTMTAADASGTIAFNISFSDVTGNAGTSVTATTNSSTVTFDKSAPSLSAVTISSNNTNTSFAKTGNTITLNFVSSKTINTPAVNIAGKTATVVNSGGNNWTATYTMLSTDNEGTIPFNISFADLTGNAGITVTTTSNSSSVLFDKTAPTISSITTSSNNANNNLAKTGSIITLNFIASETISVPVVKIAGNTAAISNTSANNWRATYTMRTADVEGLIAYSIAFNDPVGNTGAAVAANSTIVFDKTAPTLTYVSIRSNNSDTTLAKAGNTITVRFNTSEKIASPVVTIAGNTAAVTATGTDQWNATYNMTNADANGNINFTIAFADPAGNTDTTVSSVTNSSLVRFDKTVPVVDSIKRQSPLAASVNVSSLVYRVYFSEFVAGISTASFVLTTTSTATASIVSVSALSGTFVDVTVNNATGEGNIRLDLKSAGTNITDRAGNAVSNGFTSGEMYSLGSKISFTNTGIPVFAVCQNATAVDINALLGITSLNSGVTLTWNLANAPSHGTMIGFPASAAAGSASTPPTGLTYQPTAGYSGSDVFTVDVTDGISVITTNVNVTIHALPTVVIAAAQGTILCGTTTLLLNASGGVTYTWVNNSAQVPNVSSSPLTISTTGLYTATGTDANGCSNTSNSITITQLQKPTAAFVNDTYCVNKAINFTNQSVVASSGAVTYAWDYGNNNTSNVFSPSFTYTQQGTYTVTLTVTPTACPSLADIITKSITTDLSAAGIRMPTQNVPVNLPFALQAGNGSSFVWSPVTGLSSSTSQNTTAVIQSEQQYTVAITAASGCVTVDTILLRSFVQSDIILPNVFSPNNDGQNDKLIPNLVGMASFHYLRVFNRAGKKLYESSNPNDGWDGKLNGVNQPIDTYNWIAEGVDKNGLVVRRFGAVTILR